MSALSGQRGVNGGEQVPTTGYITGDRLPAARLQFDGARIPSSLVTRQNAEGMTAYSDFTSVSFALCNVQYIDFGTTERVWGF